MYKIMTKKKEFDLCKCRVRPYDLYRRAAAVKLGEEQIYKANILPNHLYWPNQNRENR